MPLAPNDLPEILGATEVFTNAVDDAWKASSLPKKVRNLLDSIKAAFDKDGPKGSKVTRKEFEAIRAKLRNVLLTAAKEDTPEDLRDVWAAGFDLLHTLKTAWRD